MNPLPDNLVDLALAPVALQLKHRREELGAMDRTELSLHIPYERDRQGATEAQRAREVVTAVTRLVDTRAWEPSWDARGIRLRHGRHSLVLGVSGTLREYVDGSRRP